MPPKKKSVPSHKKVNLNGVISMVDEELKVSLLAPQLYRHFLKTYCKVGDKVQMIITTQRPSRTQSQNNFYHVYLSLIALSSGHTIKELKAWVRGKILGKGITEIYGDKVRITESSADLNINEFCEMMNRIEEITKIPIPDPTPFNVSLTWDEHKKLKVKQTEKYRGMKAKNLKI